MNIQIDGSLPVAMFYIFGILTGLVFTAYPFIRIGMWLQKRKDPRDRQKVSIAIKEKKKAVEKKELMESEMVFMYNVSHEFVRQINNFMRKMNIKIPNKEGDR